jgi:ATP-dependent helicase/DNAse subunit B
VVDSIKKLDFDFLNNVNIQFVYEFIKETLNDLSIPFEGHPLKGIQIIGMLEARLISFDNLFVTDVNEGILPEKNKIDPLISEDVKSLIGLTGFREKERLIKYYFFRMIYSSKRVFIAYKTGSTTIEKSVKSRFVDQLILLNELKNKENKIHKFNMRIPDFENQNSEFKRDQLTKEFFTNRIFKKYLSPTEIDLYMNCPYKYYLHKIKNIDLNENFSSSFEADSVGILIHYILQKGFEPYIYRIINEENYANIKEQVKDLV